MKMAFSPFSIVHEPHAIVCTCFMPKGATYKSQHHLTKNVGNEEHDTSRPGIPPLCLVCFSKINGEWNSASRIIINDESLKKLMNVENL